MTTTTEVEELTRSNLDDMGIDAPSEMLEAYRTSADTITVLVPDPEGGSYLDAPNQDNSGEDAWEWIAFDNGRERDEWIAHHFDCSECNEPPHEGASCPAWDEPHACTAPDAFNPTTDFWIERYEHGLVNYAPIGEASQVDRRWDVAFGVALVRFTKPDAIGPDGDPNKLINFARGICEEYTSWCNGDVYGLVTFERRSSAPAMLPPFMTADDFDTEWVEADSCGGFVGYTYAVQAAKEGL